MPLIYPENKVLTVNNILNVQEVRDNLLSNDLDLKLFDEETINDIVYFFYHDFLCATYFMNYDSIIVYNLSQDKKNSWVCPSGSYIDVFKLEDIVDIEERKIMNCALSISNFVSVEEAEDNISLNGLDKSLFTIYTDSNFIYYRYFGFTPIIFIKKHNSLLLQNMCMREINSWIIP